MTSRLKNHILNFFHVFNYQVLPINTDVTPILLGENHEKNK